MIFGAVLLILLALLAFGALIAYVTFWLVVVVGGSILFMCALVLHGYQEGVDSGDYSIMVGALVGLAVIGLVGWLIAKYHRQEEIRRAKEEAIRKAREEAERRLRQAQDGPVKHWLRGLFF